MKSHNDLLPVCRCIIIDAKAKCTTDISICRDLRTISSRLKHEGMSFLTITLPSFGQDFERSLAEERIPSDAFLSFKKARRLPAFLQGFVGLVFDARTGGLLNEPDIAAIEGIRQIAYAFKKVAMPCTLERESKALSSYEEIEQQLSDTMSTRDADLFLKVSDLLWGNVFNESYDSEKYIPKHGPGQTAERISGNRKYSHFNWTERLEPFFPIDSYLFGSSDPLWDEQLGPINVVVQSQEQELPVRVITVPKTLKGPRIIAIEPVCMQYTQQALASYIIKRLSTHRLTRGHLNFDDQTVNQELAISASRDGSLATIDLSAASDRVSLSLVTSMLRVKRDLLDAILACRSKAAQLPSGKVLNLKKFASMGSALCFPIQEMVFFSIIITCMLKKQNLPVTLRNIYKVSRKVYVYGDDIIVPVDEVEAVMQTLTEFSCKVNIHKSFWKGKFRESCGVDAYDGHIVTPIYIHYTNPHNRDSAKEIISLVASSNLFYRKGYWKTAALLKQRVESIIGELPIISETSPGLGLISFQRGKLSTHRWNKKLHRPEIRAYVPSPVYKDDPLDGWGALQKFFLNAERRSNLDLMTVDKKHLLRSPRFGTVTLKRRWTTPY